jgi:hypothetical protein
LDLIGVDSINIHIALVEFPSFSPFSLPWPVSKYNDKSPNRNQC